MKATFYRLGEYKITESDTDQVTWEAHFGFGEFQKGRCFRKGSILFFGPAENYRNGFLKGEFLDDLKKYPQWLNTKFYCTGVDVHYCKNGKRVTKEDMMLWTIALSHSESAKIHPEALKNLQNRVTGGKVTEYAPYRLQRYKIIVKTEGQIISKTYSGPNTVGSGNCFILENILFIGPQQNEPLNLGKRQFLADLQQLPRWDKTEYFCKRLSLHECKALSRIKEERKRFQRESNATNKHDVGNDYKTNSEYKTPSGTYREIFSAGLSAILGSFANIARSRSENGRFSHFRFFKSYISKIITTFSESGIRIMKKTTRTIVLILLIIASIFVSMVSYLKKHHKKWHDKKNEHSLDHHEDH